MTWEEACRQVADAPRSRESIGKLSEKNGGHEGHAAFVVENAVEVVVFYIDGLYGTHFETVAAVHAAVFRY